MSTRRPSRHWRWPGDAVLPDDIGDEASGLLGHVALQEPAWGHERTEHLEHRVEVDLNGAREL